MVVDKQQEMSTTNSSEQETVPASEMDRITEESLPINKPEAKDSVKQNHQVQVEENIKENGLQNGEETVLVNGDSKLEPMDINKPDLIEGETVKVKVDKTDPIIEEKIDRVDMQATKESTKESTSVKDKTDRKTEMPSSRMSEIPEVRIVPPKTSAELGETSNIGVLSTDFKDDPYFEPEFRDISYFDLDVNMKKHSKPVVSPLVSKKDYLLKVVMLGEVGVGKTSVVSRYHDEHFSNDYRATIGVDFSTKTVDWNGNIRVGVSIWDIAGSERMGNMTRILYRDAVGAIIVFDVTRPSTLNAALKWKEDLDSKVLLPDGSSVACILMGNKCDLVKQGMIQDAQKMRKFCDTNGFLSWFETSAKIGSGIDSAFSFLINRMLMNKLRLEDPIDPTEKIILKQEEKKEATCMCF